METTKEMEKLKEAAQIDPSATTEPNVHLPFEDDVYLRKEKRATMIIMIVMVLMAIAIGVGTGAAIFLGGA